MTRSVFRRCLSSELGQLVRRSPSGWTIAPPAPASQMPAAPVPVRPAHRCCGPTFGSSSDHPRASTPLPSSRVAVGGMTLHPYGFTRAMQSISIFLPLRRIACTVVRAGYSDRKNSRYTSFMASKSFRSAICIETLTTFSRLLFEAFRILEIFLSSSRVSDRISPSPMSA
jgi:hypothetical protein